jgi:hypothetical protein
MPPRSRPASCLLPLVVLGLTLGIGGCGTDDIQFNGGIFDAIGLNDAKPTGNPKIAERAPLVVPPSLDRLPPPGEAPAAPQIANINDPDAAKQKSRSEQEAAQAEYCKKNYDEARMRGEEASMAEGPLGPCRPSVLTAIKKWTEGEDAAAEGQ